MSRWYRAYAGTVSDAKIGEAGLVAECSRSVCIAVWHALLESAAETNDAGRFDTTARRVAAILGEPVATIDRVLAAFDEIGLKSGNVIAAWRKRQYESDNSTERSHQHRERQRNADATLRNADATLRNADASPPETDTETDTETEKKVKQERSPSGSRLAPDWQPTADLIAFAAKEGFSPDEIARTAEQFRDYWHAVAGAKGRKADWPATWRSWVRRDLDRRANGGRQGDGPDKRRSAAREDRSRRLANALASCGDGSIGPAVWPGDDGEAGAYPGRA